jgi:predicted lactoylglutathione lyase
MKLRHCGLMVKSIEDSKATYEALGFKEESRGQFRTLKMVNKYGQRIELVEGDYKAHIAVNWAEDLWGNLIEITKEGDECR